MKIRIAASGAVTVENVYQFEVGSTKEAMLYFWKGLKNKMMASHRLNQASSRSHCILTLTVTQVDYN